MRARGPLGLAAAGAGLLLALAPLATAQAGGEAPDPGAAPTSTPTPTPGTAFAVDDAQLRWGLNDESHNRAFAPGTVNFVSAGVVPDPGRGGSTVRDGVWSSTGATAWWGTAGDVAIEKRRADGSWGPATFAGLSTQDDGTPLGSPTSGTTSGHQVVLDGGTGTVDPDAGTASVQWTGSFSVLFYSGMSFFTVTDPRLEITPSSATLTGEVGGYASDMADTAVWAPVPAVRVVLADLPRETLALPSAGGFTATPRYLQVPWDGGGQVRSGAAWGSFPASFVQQQTRVGAAAYWYSSGGATDAMKVARPLTVSWSADAPVPVAAEPLPAATRPSATPRAPSAPAPPRATRPTPTAPTAGSTAGTANTTSAGGRTGDTPGDTPGDPLPAAPDPGSVPVLAAPSIPDPRPPTAPVVLALAPASAGTGGADPDHRWRWWLGTFLLLGAAGTSLSSRRPSPSRGTP